MLLGPSHFCSNQPASGTDKFTAKTYNMYTNKHTHTHTHTFPILQGKFVV